MLAAVMKPLRPPAVAPSSRATMVSWSKTASALPNRKSVSPAIVSPRNYCRVSAVARGAQASRVSWWPRKRSFS